MRDETQEKIRQVAPGGGLREEHKGEKKLNPGKLEDKGKYH